MRLARFGQRAALTSIAALALLTLAGCSVAPAPPRPSPSVPSSFPASVPVIPGRVLATDVTAGEWKIWVRAPHPAAAYTAAMARLTNAGMHTTSSQTFSDSGDGQACDSKYCATVSAYDDPKYGPSVQYDVFTSKHA